MKARVTDNNYASDLKKGNSIFGSECLTDRRLHSSHSTNVQTIQACFQIKLCTHMENSTLLRQKHFLST